MHVAIYARVSTVTKGKPPITSSRNAVGLSSINRRTHLTPWREHRKRVSGLLSRWFNVSFKWLEMRRVNPNARWWTTSHWPIASVPIPGAGLSIRAAPWLDPCDTNTLRIKSI